MSELGQVRNSGLPGDGTSDAEQQRVARLLGDAADVAMPDDVFGRIRGALSIEVQLRREGVDPDEVIGEAEQDLSDVDQNADAGSAAPGEEVRTSALAKELDAGAMGDMAGVTEMDADPDLDAELDRDLEELELADGEDDLTAC